MKPSAQRLAAMAALLLILAGAWWWAAGGGATVRGPQEMGRADAGMWPTAAPAAAPRVSRLMAAQRPAIVEPAPAKIVDRFQNCAVIEKRESVREENGVQKVRRLRLVRKEGFKYPLIRVEDELVRRPDGDQLVKQIAMVGDHVLVKLNDPQAAEAQVLAQLKQDGATVRRKMPASGTLLIAFPNPTVDTVPQAVAQFSSMKRWVRYAEPDFIVHTELTPDDSSFASLWGMHNTGQSSGTADADIDAPEAWALQTGSAGVVVAVIDTGIDQTHPDLVDNLWTHPGEIGGNGLDDDGNGYVDDTRGWDFVNDDAIPQDDHNHGTHTAGTIGAVGNNSIGVTGVCWDVSLVALKFLDAAGNGALSDGVEAVAYATDAGVTLTSNSWGGGGYSQALKDAIDEADVAGILFVAAAGNSSANMETDPGYPASYTSDNVISVASTTRTDGLSSFSNYGSTTTDLGAPGSEIYSTVPGGGYATYSGTSMAAPHVSGACALLKAFKPGLSHAEIKDLLLNSADAIPALEGKTLTGGRLNVFNAMLASDDILASPGAGLVAGGPVGGPFVPAAKIYTLTNYGPAPADWTAGSNRPWVTLSAAGGTLAPGESTTVTVSLHHDATGLLAGVQTAAVTFTSLATGRVQTRTVSVSVDPPPMHVFNLDTDPGWSRTGQWAYGVPAGQGGEFFGYPDPSAGATGTNVFGINLSGDYVAVVEPAQYLTAGPFDLSDRHSARLRFQRWLNSDYQYWVYATVEASTDGITWTTVWDNGTDSIEDSQWTPVEVDLAAVADGQPQVYVRWRHEVADEYAYPLSGWNLDDIEIVAVPTRQLRLTLPEPLTELGAAGVAKVTASPVLGTDLVVQLASNRPGEEASWPASVTIPAGEEQVTFEIAVLDDNLTDGTQDVTVTASAADYPSHSALLQVHDNEQATLALALPASLAEGAGTVLGQAFASLPAPADADIVVLLTSSDTTELTVPDQVVIPFGQTSAGFTLTMPEDMMIDGAQAVTVTARVANWPDATAIISVADNEPLHLTVTLPAVRLENAGTVINGGMVSTSGVVESALTVTLASDDATELTVPEQVVIAEGNSSAFFNLSFQDDALVDGLQTVQVTASAVAFTSGNVSMLVSDDETPALPVDPSPAPNQSPTHPDSDLAWDVDPSSGGMPDSFEVYFGSAPEALALLGTIAPMQWVLPRLQPDATYHWRVVAKLGALTREGPLWSFTVPPVGEVRHFGWSDLPSAVAAGTSFTGRLTALDEYDNVVNAFSGPVDLSAFVSTEDTTTGTGSFSWFFPLATYYHDARTQSIYTPAEVGPAGRLTSLALEVVTIPGQSMKSFTIRLKHSAKTNYSDSGANTWESSGWTVVHQSTQTITTTGWTTFEFTTPFEFDGTSNLMVDICFNNNTYTTDGNCRATTVATARTLAYRTDSAYGDPLGWSGTTPFAQGLNTLPNLRFHRADLPAAVSPAVTGLFANGTWSGGITFADAVTPVRLKAQSTTDATVFGLSELIQVAAVNNFVLNPEPLFTGGTSNTLSWMALGAGYEYEVQRATVMTFSDAVSSAFVPASDHTFAGLADGQLYHYRGRARASGITGDWSAPVRSTQDATPPTLAIAPRSGGATSANSFELQGTSQDLVSGVANLTVNGSAVASGNAFADWSQLLLQLPEGTSTYAVTASDNAVPPNIHAEDWTITRISEPLADPDRNGVPALLEFAFNAPGPQGGIQLPSVASEFNPDTEQRHLLLTYRRRINHDGLDYVLETSENLSDWQPAAGDAELLSITPVGDGITEQVVMRIQPAMSAHARRFVRVRVAVQ